MYCIFFLFLNFHYKTRHNVWHWTPSNGRIIRSICLLISAFTSPSPSGTLCTPKTKEKACISYNPLMSYHAMLSAIMGHVVRNRAGLRQYTPSVWISFTLRFFSGKNMKSTKCSLFPVFIFFNNLE